MSQISVERQRAIKLLRNLDDRKIKVIVGGECCYLKRFIGTGGFVVCYEEFVIHELSFIEAVGWLEEKIKCNEVIDDMQI